MSSVVTGCHGGSVCAIAIGVVTATSVKTRTSFCSTDSRAKDLEKEGPGDRALTDILPPSKYLGRHECPNRHGCDNENTQDQTQQQETPGKPEGGKHRDSISQPYPRQCHHAKANDDEPSGECVWLVGRKRVRIIGEIIAAQQL